MAKLLSLLFSKFNFDPYTADPNKRPSEQGFDENAWDRDHGDYEPVVVDIDSDDEVMDVDVNFQERTAGAGHIDMKTGKMVFE